MMWWLLACGTPAADNAAATIVVPTEGPWTVHWAQTYGGDCVLAEMDTRQPADIGWRLELEANGFTFYDEFDYPVGCDLEEGVFVCYLGTYPIEWDGYDARESITTQIDGAFDSPDSFAGTYSIHADCDGGDCGLIRTQYGDDFHYPCTALADMTGESGER